MFNKAKHKAVAIEAETDEQSIERAVYALDGYAMAQDLEESHEKEFYCGICGFVPISQYREHMSKH